MDQTKDQAKKPVTIKKYANRRLYNTETSTYVTLEDLAEMVRGNRDFVVFDAKSGEDLTHSVLTQIILEQESRGGQNLLPVNFLRQLIRFYGDSMGRLVPSYLNMSMETLSREQERFRKQMTETWGTATAAGGHFASVPFGTAPFGAAALEAMQEQTRHNMELFQKAMSLWSPFGAAGLGASGTGAPLANGSGHQPSGATDQSKPMGSTQSRQAPAELAAPAAANSDLAIMREQLAAMQRQLDRLSKDGE
jgi:polyhydroxyalkanoate synthesis repressor PhaR